MDYVLIFFKEAILQHLDGDPYLAIGIRSKIDEPEQRLENHQLVLPILYCVNQHISDRLNLLIFQQIAVYLFAEKGKELSHCCLLQLEGLQHSLYYLWVVKMTGVYFCDLVHDFTPFCESFVLLDLQDNRA